QTEDPGGGAQGRDNRVLRGNSWNGRAGERSNWIVAPVGDVGAASGKRSHQHAGEGRRDTASFDAGAGSAGDGESDCDGADSDAGVTRAAGSGKKTIVSGSRNVVFSCGGEFHLCRGEVVDHAESGSG